MLPDNLGIPVSEPILSMPAPSLPGVPSVAFPDVDGASGLLSSSVVASESPFPQKMQDNSSYPQIKDNSLVSPIESLSPMHTDPPNLCFSPPADRASPIVGCVLGFDAKSEAHHLQQCDYHQVKNTCTVEHCLNTDAAMEDMHGAPSAAGSEDATKIECALRNASISGCKDAFPVFHSTDDDEDERGGEDQVDARMSDNLSFGGVGSTGASRNSDANPAECSG